MPSLDDALERLAEQDRPIPVDDLVDRIELGLRGGSRPRLAPADPMERRRTRRRPLVIFVGAAIAACAVAIPALLTNSASPDTPTTAPVIATTLDQPPIPIDQTTTSSLPATATAPTPVPFEPAPIAFARDVVDSYDTAPGTFSSSGALVDAGLICGGGSTFENGYEDLRAGRERWEERFLCSDGSGSFTLVVESVGEWRAEPGSTWDFVTTWTWSPDDATGQYVGIEGRGEGNGSCTIPDDRCVESLDGVLWRIERPVDE
jgi:hypothetical protein